jgi:hypothetical protein
MTKRMLFALSVLLIGFPVCVPAFAIDDDNVFHVYEIVRGENPDGSVTLTPSKQYEMLTETREQVANCVNFLRNRIKKLEDRVFALENTSAINPSDTRRIQELERIVHGLQKQVTILHGKKADKPAKKASKQQAIPIVVGDGENVGILTH